MSVLLDPLKAVARKAGLRRARVAGIRMQAEREVLARTAKRQNASAGRILCYHSVGTSQWGVNDVTPERFQQHLELALQFGYRFVPAASVAAGTASPNDLAITFDDGVLSVALNAAPILAEYGIPWTLFVVTEWADGRHNFGEGVVMGWREIEALAASGVEVGSHSVSHPDFGTLGLNAARQELVESRQTIEVRTGIRAASFAIPIGQSGNWRNEVAEVARSAGYEFIYAQSVSRRPSGTVARTFVTQFDDRRLFAAALQGAYDSWEEWA